VGWGICVCPFERSRFAFAKRFEMNEWTNQTKGAFFMVGQLVKYSHPGLKLRRERGGRVWGPF
jgi:hypothetical protein